MVHSLTQSPEKRKEGSLLLSYVMISFDVTFLFNSIPKDPTVNTVELLLRSKYDLLGFSFRKYFVFDRTIYEHLKKTLIGSPISVLIAEAATQRVKVVSFPPPQAEILGADVDAADVESWIALLAVHHKPQNSVFLGMQFTMEEEENNQLVFLDVPVYHKECDGLKTKVLRKAKITSTEYQQKPRANTVV
ncbi:unnamed protein product [Dibothriocephalus latus]|uniref:Uncharacterized protein n=1 Tax=Dibothriocephalus latus TaxID=60516 RepID=A0A3P7M585_DIBLA|nr:unnamed protein product [Dibothriocephalus latus]